VTPDTKSIVGEIVLFPQSGKTFVAAERAAIFEQWLLGWPSKSVSGGITYLNRNPPLAYEPEYWLDDRVSGSSRRRWILHASKIESCRTVGLRGNDQNISGGVTTWDKRTAAYEVLIYTVRFETLPYEILYRDGPEFNIGPNDGPAYTIAAGADPAYDGEWSRWTDWSETESVRVLQFKAGITWDNTAGAYGQPASPVSATAISYTDGTPKIVGENIVVCTWYDVPYYAYDWTKITSRFGSVNNADFCLKTKSPFRTYLKESLLLATATRFRKTNILGEPSYNIRFQFQHSPGPDGKGMWNRLYNKNGEPQRIKLANGDPLYTTTDFTELFKPS
jgi:hypothetical protein